MPEHASLGVVDRSDRQRAVLWILVAVTALAILLPVWTAPLLVTTDGPSHVYNAVIAASLRSGTGPYASLLAEHTGFAPNRTAVFLLGQLGRRFGWDPAERVLLGLCIGAVFAVLLLAIKGPGGRLVMPLVPIAGWLAQSWFAWMGFYDFSLSVVWFVVLSLVLSRPLTPQRLAGAQLLLGALFLTHFFTFVAGVALLSAALGWYALTGRGRWKLLLWALPSLTVLSRQLLGGGVVGGSIGWASHLKAGLALVVGDVVISFHAIDLVAGVVLMSWVWCAVTGHLVHAQRHGWRTLKPAEILALLFFLLSVLAPDRIGDGSYIPARLRLFGVVLLLPAAANAVPPIARKLLERASAAALLVLLAHAAVVVRASERVARDFAAIQSLLASSGAHRGSLVQTQFADNERGLYRISGYRHLTDRASARLELIALDNYEAGNVVFPVKWRDGALLDTLRLRPTGSGWVAELVPRDQRWPGPVLVVHESSREVRAAPGLFADPAVSSGQFAITPIVRDTVSPPKGRDLDR